MEITDSILSYEIDDVLDNGETNTNFYWTAEVHINDDEILEPLKILAVTSMRDYVNSFADEVTVRLMFLKGKYARRIYPNRDNLQITLTKTKIGEFSSEVYGDEDAVSSERFRAYLINPGPSPTEAQGRESLSEETLDASGVLEIDFQLINKNVEQLRITQTGGVFINTKLDDLLSTLITTGSEKVKIDDGDIIDSVNILPISNKETKQQVVIPHGTLLVEVPGYLQSKIGIYNSGLGSYIQNGCWYIYYLWNTKNFETRQDTVTFIILPPNKYPNIERTYKEENDSKVLLVTGQTAFADDNSARTANEGNGLRFADADKLMADTVKVSGNKAIISRGKLNTEIVVGKRDVITNSPSTNIKITSNTFSAYSALNSRMGGLFVCVWQSSDPSFLTPGMAVKILYDDTGELKEYWGILIGCEYVSLGLGGISENRYSNQCRLTVFINKKT